MIDRIESTSSGFRFRNSLYVQAYRGMEGNTFFPSLFVFLCGGVVLYGFTFSFHQFAYDVPWAI